MPLVTRDDVEMLKTPHLDALLYLKGVTWGPKARRAPEKWATVWRVLSDNCDIDAAPVNDTLWIAALRTTVNWRVGDLEELRAQLRLEKMGEPPSTELGGQSVTATDMPLNNANMDECPLAKQAGTRRPVTHPVGGRMTKQTA